MARLILDTGVRITGIRGHLDVATLADADDVAVTAVAVAEYLAGTLLDSDPGGAAAQRVFLEEVLEVLPGHEYDRDVAEHHAALLPRCNARGARGVRTTSSSRPQPAPPTGSC